MNHHIGLHRDYFHKVVPFKELVRKIDNLRFVHGMTVFWFALFATQCLGQGTLTITFDGFPKPGQSFSVPYYYTASGVLFEPLFYSSSIGRTDGTGTTLWPNDGTAYLQAAAGESLQFSFLDNSVFDLTSVDLTGYSTVVPGFNVDFVGYRADGSIVTKNISGSGINFNTYYFDSRFTDLTRVEIPGDGWSLDNVVLTVPEPSETNFLVLSIVAFWLLRPSRCDRRRAIPYSQN